MVKTLAAVEQACDGQAGSKWLDFGANEGRATWLEYDLLVSLGCEPPTPAASYSLTSANDFPDRDPADFRLEGLLWSPSASPSTPVSQQNESQAPAVEADHSQSDALAQEMGHGPASMASSPKPEAHVPAADADQYESDALAQQPGQQSAANEGVMLQDLSISGEPGSTVNVSGNSNGHAELSDLHASSSEQHASPVQAQHASPHRKIGPTSSIL